MPSKNDCNDDYQLASTGGREGTEEIIEKELKNRKGNSEHLFLPVLLVVEVPRKRLVGVN